MSGAQEHHTTVEAEESGGEPAEVQDSRNGSKFNTVRDTLATGVCIAAMVLGGIVCLAVNFHWL